MSRRRLLFLPCLWAACTSLQVALRLIAEYAFVQLRPTASSSARVASSRPLSRSPARFPLCRDQVQRPRRLRRRRGREPPSGRPPSRLRLRATPLVGTEAPPFTAKAVSDRQFLDVSLSQYWGEKYVVLFFYPLDFSTICPTEILAFSDRYREFTDLGAEVLGVSVDSEYAHLAWIEMPRDKGGLGNVSYPLVSDLRKEIASAYEVLGPDGTALRALFIIDKEGIVQHSAINNVDMGRSVDEVLRVLQAIQFVQSNPDEVCPEGWQPEGRTSAAEEAAAQEAEEAKDEESAADAGEEDRLTVLPLDLLPDLADHRAD